MAATSSYTLGYPQGYIQLPVKTQLEAHVQALKPPAPFAMFPAFISQKPETLVIKSTSAWTNSSYNISTLDGRVVFSVKRGETFSFSYRRRVHDANGQPIFTIKRESRFLQPTIYHALAPSEAGPRLFECEFDPWASGDKCTGHFVNATNGAPETFYLAGNFFQSKAKITNQATGQVVAQIKKQAFTWKTEYHIFIQPGVDMALVVALCIVMHDRQESHKSSAGVIAVVEAPAPKC